MNIWIATAGVLTPVAAASALLWHRRARNRMYARLAAGQADVADLGRVELDVGQPRDAHSLASAFAAGRLIRVDQFVAPATLAQMRDDASSGIPHMDHSFIPLHKKGSTLSYEQILRRAPHLVAFYQGRSLQRWVSSVTGTTVRIPLCRIKAHCRCSATRIPETISTGTTTTISIAGDTLPCWWPWRIARPTGGHPTAGSSGSFPTAQRKPSTCPRTRWSCLKEVGYGIA
jgi:hypothetical protein